MTSKFTYRRIILTCVTCVLAAVAIIAVSTREGGGGSADASQPRTLRQAFGVLREASAAESSNKLSGKAEIWLASVESSQGVDRGSQIAGLGSESSIAVDASDSIASPGPVTTVEDSSGATAVVAEVNEGICALVEGSGIGLCADQALAEAGHAFSAAPSGCNAYKVVGFMPDGVSSLSVLAPSHQDPQSIPVRSNLYEVTLSAEDTVLKSDQAGVEVELPLGSYKEANPDC